LQSFPGCHLTIQTSVAGRRNSRLFFQIHNRKVQRTSASFPIMDLGNNRFTTVSHVTILNGRRFLPIRVRQFHDSSLHVLPLGCHFSYSNVHQCQRLVLHVLVKSHVHPLRDQRKQSYEFSRHLYVMDGIPVSYKIATSLLLHRQATMGNFNDFPFYDCTMKSVAVKAIGSDKLTKCCRKHTKYGKPFT